jgi:hypothetical protein
MEEAMRRSTMLTFVLCLASSLLAQDQILTFKKVDPSVPPFGVELKRSVVEIEMICKNGNSTLSASGTGFVVGYDDTRLPKGTYFNYLVTNRHVAQCWDDRKTAHEVESLTVRLNMKDGSSRDFSADPGCRLVELSHGRVR